MKNRWHKGEFGVESLDAEAEFKPIRHAHQIVDLRPLGVPWVPVIGRISYSETEQPAPWHVHRGCTEFIFCSSGQCDYEGEDGRYRFGPGHVFVSRPDEPHRQLSNPKGYSTFYLLFRTTANRDVRWFADAFWKLPRLFAGDCTLVARFNRILNLADQCRGRDSTGLRIRLRIEVESLLVAILDSVRLPVCKRVPRQYGQIAERMRQHPERAYPVGELAAEVGVTAASFISAFKRETGFTPHVYLLNCRVDSAKSCLRGGMSVKVAADRLGFPSAQHLSHTFRKITGISPQDWLRANRT